MKAVNRGECIRVLSVSLLIAAGLFAVEAMVFLPQAAAQASPAAATSEMRSDSAREITVTADAVSFLPPDAVEIRIAVDASAPTAQAAQAMAAEKLGVAIDGARKILPQGLTSSEDAAKYLPPGSANTAVSVTQMAVISSPALDKSGALIDALTKGTGARLAAVRFFVKDRTAEKAATSKEAVERAKKKAEAAAAAAGLSLGPVLSINLVEESANKLVRLREEQGDAEQLTGGEDYQVVASVSFGIVK